MFDKLPGWMDGWIGDGEEGGVDEMMMICY
jgi:hypothetical protein